MQKKSSVCHLFIFLCSACAIDATTDSLYPFRQMISKHRPPSQSTLSLAKVNAIFIFAYLVKKKVDFGNHRIFFVV
jgi:hypothetical protein